jgi:hypothetical protein
MEDKPTDVLQRRNKVYQVAHQLEIFIIGLRRALDGNFLGQVNPDKTK